MAIIRFPNNRSKEEKVFDSFMNVIVAINVGSQNPAKEIIFEKTFILWLESIGESLTDKNVKNGWRLMKQFNRECRSYGLNLSSADEEKILYHHLKQYETLSSFAPRTQTA